MTGRSTSHALEHASSTRLLVRLRGEPSRHDVEDLGSALERALVDTPGTEQLLVDLTQVVRIDVASCRSLARLQRKLGTHGLRTAYLAARPRVAGAAWWIVHASGDALAIPVVDEAAADRWLEGDGERLDELEARAGRALDRTREEEGR